MRCLLIVLLMGLASAQEPCCQPNQFEGWSSIINGIVNISSSDPIRVTMERTAIAVDYVDGKVSARGSDGVRTILLPNENRMYIIQTDQSCEYYPFSQSFGQCIPAFATLVRSTYFGVGDHILAVNDWRFTFQSGTSEVEASVTATGCAPVILDYSYEINKEVFIVGGARYDRITSGIDDPSVFDPPDGCQPGKADMALKKGMPLEYILTQHIKPKHNPNISLKDLMMKKPHELIKPN